MRTSLRASLLAVPLVVFLLAAGVSAGASFDSLVADGRAALDTRRADIAAQLLDQAAALDPSRAGEIVADRAWARAANGFSAVLAKDYASAVARFDEAAALCPAVAPLLADLRASARLGLFWTTIKGASDGHAADWTALLEIARGAVEVMPGRADARYAFGLACERDGRAGDAAEAYRVALRGDPRSVLAGDELRDAAESVSSARRGYKMPVHPMMLAADPGDPQVLRHGPFVIHHHNAAVAYRLARALDYYLSVPVMGGVLAANPTIGRACDIYLYRDKTEYMTATERSPWTRGCFKNERNSDESPRYEIHLYQGAPSVLEEVLPHELAHLRTALLVDGAFGLPAWVQEGIAVSAGSDYHQSAVRREVRDAWQAGRLEPCSGLIRKKSVTDSAYEVAYGQSYAMVSALVAARRPRALPLLYPRPPQPPRRRHPPARLRPLRRQPRPARRRTGSPHRPRAAERATPPRR